MIAGSPYGVNPYNTSVVAPAGVRRSLTSSTVVSPGISTYGGPIAQANYTQPIRRSIGAPVTTTAPVTRVPAVTTGYTAPLATSYAVAPRVSTPVVAQSTVLATPVATSTVIPAATTRTDTYTNSTVVPANIPTSALQGSTIIPDHTPLQRPHFGHLDYNVHPGIPRAAPRKLAPAIPETVSNGRSYTTSYPAGVDATFLQKQAQGFNYSAPNKPRWTRPVVQVTPGLVNETNVTTPVTIPQNYATTTAIPVTTPGLATSVVSPVGAYPVGHSLPYGAPVQRVSNAYY